MNKNILERARCMVSNAKLQKEMWGKVTLVACYLVNRSPLTKIGYEILEEVWIGHPYDYTNLNSFGCDVYALIPKNQHSNLGPK